MKVIKLNIKGMSCSSCSNSVEKLIDELDGIKHREVSHKENYGKIEFDKTQISEQQIIAKINESHYKVEMNKQIHIGKNKENTVCPACNMLGAKVPNTVFKSNLKPEAYSKINLETENFICKNPICNVAYYSAENKKIIHKNELKRELWYKTGTKKVLGCYCNNIDKEQIRNVYERHTLTTWDEIVPHYRKKVIEKCETINPTGHCCREDFDKIVDNIKVSSQKHKIADLHVNEVKYSTCCSTNKKKQNYINKIHNFIINSDKKVFYL